MSDKKNIRIASINICSFEKGENEIAKINLEKYPPRICVIDEFRDIVVDVKTNHQYPYIRLMNMTYFRDEKERKKVEIGKRAACIEYATLPFSQLDSKTLDECDEIINLLKQGVTFPDGNQELTNDEYLEMINSTKNVKKIKKKRK